MLASIALWASLAIAADDSHKSPAASAPSAFAEKQDLLAELWQRGVVPPDTQTVTPQDQETLARIHLAETSGALRYLRARGKVGGLVVDMKTQEGKRQRLTKAGYERWRMLRTQDALAFFQSKDIGAKDAFQLKDLQGRLLFEKDGQLSEPGQTVLNEVLTNTEAHWVTPAGEVLGNRPPPKR